MKTTLLNQVTEINERKFKAVWFEGSQVITEEFGMNIEIDMDGDEYEWKYSLLEYADQVFQLKVNETIYFQGERDCPETKGFIARIK